MGLFSRNKEAADGLRVDDVAFDALRRSPRNGRPARKDGTDSPTPLDPAEAAKSRARHRLIGAVALALAAVVFVPMLFDRAPVPTNDDISLQIPDRDSPFEGRRGVPDAAGGPLKASSELPLVPAPSTPIAVAPAATKAVVEPPPVVPSPTRPADPVEARPTEKIVTKPAEKPVEKAVDPASKASAPTDDPKALAALEGKTAAQTAEASSGRTYAVQVAAYATAAKARSVRDQLVAGGLKSYTEPVTTAQGVWTRVRLGPFASRGAADEARQKLKGMKLDGSVVPL